MTELILTIIAIGIIISYGQFAIDLDNDNQKSISENKCNNIETIRSNSTTSTGLLIVLCLLLSPIAYCFIKIIIWCN